MSSEIEGFGLIAAAVALPAAAAFGVGWLAWQGGSLLVNASRDVDRKVEAQKRAREEAARQRMLTARNTHDQLVAAGQSLLAEIRDPAQRQELQRICGGSAPKDVAELERANIAAMAVLERITRQQTRLKDVQVAGSGEIQGAAVWQVMDRLRVAMMASAVAETRGADVQAADPEVLERVELNRKLAEVSGRVMTALEFVVDLAENFGLSQANNAWFTSCFNGADARIQAMCNPAATNQELKRGIRSLEEMLKQYDMLVPTIAKERDTIATLYPVYADAARALGETVQQMKHFKSAQALEAEMLRLEERSRRAAECAQIYQKLGPAAYMCYAWDQELQAMGYAVHTRKQITEMAQQRPDRAKLGQAEMPFYQWDESGLTQLYSVSQDCDLQLIVHPDGSTTMETIARPQADAGVVETQKHHCSKVKEIHKRLMENWFIYYDYRETESPMHVQTMEAWRASDENSWTRGLTAQTGVRENVRTTEEQKTMQSK